VLHLVPVRKIDSGTEVAVIEVVPPMAAQLTALAEVEKQLTANSSPTLKPEPYWAVLAQFVPLSVSTKAVVRVSPTATQCVVEAQETPVKTSRPPELAGPGGAVAE